MNAFIYDTTQHLTPSDRSRLAAAAKHAGVSIDDFIEQTLKRAIFHPLPTPKPRKRKEAKA